MPALMAISEILQTIYAHLVILAAQHALEEAAQNVSLALFPAII